MELFRKKNDIVACALHDDIDKKIKLKYIKDKKSKRTFISGLHSFMSIEKIDEIISALKKNLGAGVTIKETDNGKEYGFQGQHADTIKIYLIEECKISKESI